MEQKIILTTLNLEEFKVILREVLLENSPSTGVSDRKRDKNVDEKLISRKEVAQILGISLPTLTQLVKQDEVRAYHLGGRVMFKRSEILSSLKVVQTQKHKRLL